MTAVATPANAVNPSLGKDCQICPPGPGQALKRRYRMSDLVARLRPNERAAQCHRLLAPGADQVAIMRDQAGGRAYYDHLIVCNRVWECPVCSARISAARADELHEAIGAAGRLGLHPVLLTLTVQHNQGADLAELLADLLAAWRDFKGRRGWDELRDEFGWVGDIRSLETTYGAAGWHPHLHILVFTSIELTPGYLAAFRRWVAERWAELLKKRGRTASYAAGVDAQTADKYVTEYIAKFGRAPENAWGPGDEMTRHTTKRGRHGGLTPWQILELYGAPLDSPLWEQPGAECVGSRKRAGALFVEYANAFKGRSQLHYSRGLRDTLGQAPPPPDNEIEEIPAQAEQLVTLGRHSWARICRRGLRGELLAVAGAGGYAALVEWLARQGIHLIDLSEFDMIGPPAQAAAPARPPTVNQPTLI